MCDERPIPVRLQEENSYRMRIHFPESVALRNFKQVGYHWASGALGSHGSAFSECVPDMEFDEGGIERG